jgi:putative DNA methylase
MSEPKKLIEVAMPIKEISAECERDSRVQHGHISSMHQWWARRPLPVCRAVVFASLVPDPLDKNCPQQFKDAIELLLGSNNNVGDPFKPYDDIPYTSAIDKMEDNLRNRLLMFIGKFSNKYIENLKKGMSTQAKDMLSENSLIKWDNKNNEKILNIARKLIWVSHNLSNDISLKDLLSSFDVAYSEIKVAENNLYSTINRHLNTIESIEKQKKLNGSLNSFLEKMPLVFDPFAGGGAIPLEASRLGCRSYCNDINPVAHIVQKGGIEFPQKFGKSILLDKLEFIKKYGEPIWNKQPNDHKVFENGDAIQIRIPNILTFDVEFYCAQILNNSFKKLYNYYPKDKQDNEPIAYYWCREVSCENPTCRAKIPFLKQFYLVNSKAKSIYLLPKIEGNKINFEIVNGKYDINSIKGFNNRGNLSCPCCNSITDVKKIKEQSINSALTERLLAVITSDKKTGAKIYRLPEQLELEIINNIPQEEIPTENMQRNSAGGDTFGWGINKWGQLFTKRQLHSLMTFVSEIHKLSNNFENSDYNRAVLTYLGIWLDRMASRMTSFGLIDAGRETIVGPFSRQAMQMIFDFPEINPFHSDQISWITRVIDSENFEFASICKNAASGEKEQFEPKSIDAVVTDPPYYDAIAYADLSDFYYIWLKRSIGHIYESNFATPQTPKSEECTALKHHHDDNKELANNHFEGKLTQIFEAIELQTKDIVSIMFAHQTTKAWSTLCNSILNAKMNITGSWAVDSEATMVGLKADKAFLSSSVTVSARPTTRKGIGDFKIVKNAIEKRVAEEVDYLYKIGFRGADLLTACFGLAVSEFGIYVKVEKADGSIVQIAELLEIARESAFNALLKGFNGDDQTKFYIAWLQLNGFSETEFDDAAKFTKIGLSINIQDLFKDHILIKNGNKQHLGSLKDRISANARLGDGNNNPIIDQAQKLMHLYSSPNRIVLLKYIVSKSLGLESPVWRVITSLAELLPKDIEDHKLAIGLLTNKEQLIREAKSSNTPKPEQSQLTFG